MNVELIEKMLKTYSVGGSGANTAVIYLFFSSLTLTYGVEGFRKCFGNFSKSLIRIFFKNPKQVISNYGEKVTSLSEGEFAVTKEKK